MISDFEIVHVDDEHQVLFIFDEFLGDEFNLKQFNNPLEAKKYILESERVLTVITDQSMPHLKGIDLAREVREEKSFLNFIMVTANPENDNELLYNTLRKNLFFDYLKKPFNFKKDKSSLINLIMTSVSNSWRNLLSQEMDLAKKIFSKPFFSLEDYKLMNDQLKEVKKTNYNIRMFLLFDKFYFTQGDDEFAFTQIKEDKTLNFEIPKKKISQKIDNLKDSFEILMQNLN